MPLENENMLGMCVQNRLLMLPGNSLDSKKMLGVICKKEIKLNSFIYTHSLHIFLFYIKR